MWSLLACARPPADAAVISTEVAAWSWTDTGATGAATLGSDVLSAELSAAIADVPRFDPLLVMVTHEGLYAYAEVECPALVPGSPGRQYWEDDCTATTGATFFGWVTWNWFRNVRDEAGRLCADDAFYYGFVRITDPDALRFDGYGTVSYRGCEEADGTRLVDASLEGDFHFDGAGETFLGAWQPVSLFWTAREGPSGHELLLDGTISGRAGPLAAVRFEGLTLTTGEPAGRVTGWDQDGHAYPIDFDGDGDGCAGEVCVDWSPLTDWTVRPWY